MAEQTEDIVGLVESVVRPLVEFPDELEITSSDAEDGTILVEVRVNEEDAGKVIGRQGRVIKAIRTLARAEAADHDFAKYLWRQDVRCLRLAALHIADPARLTPGEFAFWGDGLLNSEIAAEAAFALLSRIGAFPELFAAWIAPDAGWLRQYAALMAAARVPHPSPAWAVPAAAVVHEAAAASIPEAHLLAHGAVALFTALGTRNEENRQAVLRAAGSLGQLPAEACVHEELAWRLEV